jgi:hypothetical protein
MSTTREQAQQDHDNYWQTVADLAEQIVAEVQEAAPDEDRDEVLHRLLHESTDQHDYVIRDDLQVHTLLYSRHPCAALFNGRLLQERHSSTDAFPFAAFAAEAFEMDVSEKAKELLGVN